LKNEDKCSGLGKFRFYTLILPDDKVQIFWSNTLVKVNFRMISHQILHILIKCGVMIEADFYNEEAVLHLYDCVESC